MASDLPNLPPELASILSALSQPAPSVDQAVPQAGWYNVNAASIGDVKQDGLPFANNLIRPILHDGTRAERQSPAPVKANDSLIDPATITDWAAGLRCVSKMASQNASFAGAIKQMISNQRRNEMDWYKKRQDLKREQAQRATGSAALTSIMKTIGAASTNEAPKPLSLEEAQAEMDAFDLKIFRAQTEMNKAMTAELKALGVPFFGMDRALIVDEDAAVSQPPKTISSSELFELQRRMISYLEDMYKD